MSLDVPTDPDNRVPNLDLIEKDNAGVVVEDNKVSQDADELRVKQPCILIFDSLAGEPMDRVYSILREYLKIEYKVRQVKKIKFYIFIQTNPEY